jgi:hypothetical protein
LKADNRAFVESKYVPAGITLQEPGNLKLDELNRLLTFWRDREATDGLTETFRWSSYFKTKDLKVSAVYGERNDRDAASAKAAKRKQQRKTRKKTRIAALLPADPVDEGGVAAGAPDAALPRPHSPTLTSGTPVPIPNSPATRPLSSCDPTVGQETGTDTQSVYDPALFADNHPPSAPAYRPDALPDPPGLLAATHETHPSWDASHLDNQINNHITHGVDNPHRSAPSATTTSRPGVIADENHNATEDDTMQAIDSVTMQQLTAAGYPGQHPINGPADGDPRYLVAVSALKILEPEATTSNTVIGKRKRKTPDDPRKRKTTANDLFFKEAQGILHQPSSRTNRSGLAGRTRSKVTAPVSGRGAVRTTRARPQSRM